MEQSRGHGEPTREQKRPWILTERGIWGRTERLTLSKTLHHFLQFST